MNKKYFEEKMNTRFTICTEAKLVEVMLKIVAESFPSFSASTYARYWKGVEEQGIRIEVYATDSSHDYALITHLALRIKELNNQEAILITDEPVNACFV